MLLNEVSPGAWLRPDYRRYDKRTELGQVHDAFQRRLEEHNFNLTYLRRTRDRLLAFRGRDPQAMLEAAIVTLQAAPGADDVLAARSLLADIASTYFADASLNALKLRVVDLCRMMSTNIAQKRPREILRRVNWAVYNKCPMVCAGCYNPFVQRQLTLDEAIPILNKLADAGVDTIKVAGGDPMLWPSLLSFVTEASALGMRIGLDSTGVSLSGAMLASLAPFVDTFAFPYDALDNATIQTFRRVPQIDLRAIADNVLELCSRVGVNHLRIYTLVSRQNLAQLPALADRLEASAVVDQWHLLQWWDRRATTRQRERLAIDSEVFDSQRPLLAGRLSRMELLATRAEERAFTNFYIRSDGVVVTFGARLGEEFIAGDLNTQSVAEILQSPAIDTRSLLTALSDQLVE